MSNMKNFMLEMERRVQASKQLLVNQQSTGSNVTLGGHWVPRRNRSKTIGVLDLLKKSRNLGKDVDSESNTQLNHDKNDSSISSDEAQASSSNAETHETSVEKLLPIAKLRSERLLCRFFVKNGIPLSNVEDKLLEEYFSKIVKVEKPNYDDLKKCLNDAEENEQIFEFENNKVYSTIDYIKEEEITYLAFTIHAFDESKLRRERVFLLKLDSFEYEVPSLMSAVLQACSPLLPPNTPIEEFIVTDHSIGDAIFNQVHPYSYSVCFYTTLTNFANDIILMPQFKQSADMLIDMVTRIKLDPDFYLKFRELSGSTSLPSVDVTSWVSISLFISKCLKMKDTLSSMSTILGSDLFDQPNYINLCLLMKILIFCQKCSHRIANDNMVSVVVPIIMDVIKFTDEEMLDMSGNLKELIDVHLFPLISEEKYMIACLLDPRFAYSTTLYTEETWSKIEEKTRKTFQLENLKLARDVARVLKQFEKYREAIKTERAGKYTYPYFWWRDRKNELKGLIGVAKNILCQPAVAIDVHYYFGKFGKYKHMCSVLNDEELIDTLKAASKEEQIRNRGTISEKEVNLIMLEQNDQNEEEDEKNRQEESKKDNNAEEIFGMNYVEKQEQESAHLNLLNSEDLLKGPIGPEFLMEEPLSKQTKVRKTRKASKKHLKIDELQIPEIEPTNKIIKIENPSCDEQGTSKGIKIEIKEELVEAEEDGIPLNYCNICAALTYEKVICIEQLSDFDKLFITISQLLLNEICLNDAMKRLQMDVFNVCRNHCVLYSKKLLDSLGVQRWQDATTKSMAKLHHALKSLKFKIDNNDFITAFQTFFEEYNG